MNEINIPMISQLITVEDLRKFSASQLVYQVATKMNELVEVSNDFGQVLSDTLNNQNLLIDQLINEGVPNEVLAVFYAWLEDGTWEQLINEQVYHHLSQEVDQLADQVNQIATKGTTVDVIRQATSEEITKQIDDGTLAYLTIEDLSIDGKKIQAHAITPDKTTFFLTDQSINLLDERNARDGYYRAYNHGGFRENSAFYCTDFILLQPGDYILSHQIGKTVSGQITFFNHLGEYVSGIDVGNDYPGQPTPVIKMPALATYAVFSFEIANKGKIQVEKGTTVHPFTTFHTNTFIHPDYVNKQVAHQLTIDNRQPLKDIFESLEPGEPYQIYLEPGVYNTLEGYTTAELEKGDFYGLFVPDGVELIGLGNREQVILSAEFSTPNIRVSTLNLARTSTLKNLTVIGTKTRYAIHDDFADLTTDSSDTYQRTIHNCHIKGVQTYYSVAYGSGTRSGAIWDIKDSCFENLTGGFAFATHSRQDFRVANQLRFENCQFISKTNYGIKIGGMASGVINEMQLIGCQFNGLEIREEVAGSQTGIDYHITGYGNTINHLYGITNSLDSEYNYCFNDQMSYHLAYLEIKKGQPVYYNNGVIAPMTSSVPAFRFYGIAKTSAATGERVLIQHKGQVAIQELDVNCPIGGKLTVKNGQLVIASFDEDIVGRHIINGFIQL